MMNGQLRIVTLAANGNLLDEKASSLHHPLVGSFFLREMPE